VSTAQLNIINSTIRTLLTEIDDLKYRRIKLEDVLKTVDELEDQIDGMISRLAPERITDERFSAAVNAVKDVSKEMKELRDAIISGRYALAKKKVLDVQSVVRNAYRLLILLHAGSPTTLIFQVTPQFLREELLSAPEALVFANPMASQIYSILQRKGKASVEELAFELKIDDETRDQFNNAIAHLIATGYAKPYYDSSGKMILKPAKG